MESGTAQPILEGSIIRHTCPTCGHTKEVKLGSMAERLKYLRERAGKSPSEVSAGIGGGKVLSSGYVNQLESGKAKHPGFEILVGLADFFVTTIDWITCRTDHGP